MIKIHPTKIEILLASPIDGNLLEELKSDAIEYLIEENRLLELPISDKQRKNLNFILSTFISLPIKKKIDKNIEVEILDYQSTVQLFDIIKKINDPILQLIFSKKG